MNILARLTISTKILLLLLMLGAGTLAIALAGSRSLSIADDSNALMVKEAKAPLYLARASRNATEMVYNAFRTVTYPGASKDARDAAAAEQTAYASGSTWLDKAVAIQPSLKAPVAGLAGQLAELHALTLRASTLGVADKDVEATKILVEADANAADFIRKIVSLNDATVAAADASAAALTLTAQSANFWMLALSVAGAVVSIGAGLVVSRVGITGPLTRLKAAMQALAAGNNSAEVGGIERRDEIGEMARVVLVFRDAAIAKAAADAEKAAAEATVQTVVDALGASLQELSNRDLTGHVTADFPGVYAVLKDNFNAAIDNIRATIEQVSDSALSIRTGSNEIAQASEDLARRTEGTAASLEQTSVALLQIDSRMKATAVSSGQTVTRADQAITTVGGGRATADEAVAAMGRVSDSAKGIDSVIEGLDKIAFQTRVLAMNAAVEAGRAGDAGRGFAVVADLVSALAMRAEEEAKRARDQLTLTQTDIGTAVRAVQKVDGALENISNDVGEVHKLLGTMAGDAVAQSTAITQITAAIGEMDRSTQQNAAMVEQTSAAARNLTQEVRNLDGAAEQFRVDRAGTARATAPARSTRAAAAGRTPSPAVAPAQRRQGPNVANSLSNGHANVKASDSDWSSF